MIAKFCIQCGTSLEEQEMEGRSRLVCPACGWVHYEQLKVGAGVLIEQDGKLLLLQRARNPWLGAWNIPAGYSEADEHPTQTAVREVHEETGLKIEIQRFLREYFFENDPRGNGLMLVYRGQVTGGELRGSTESSVMRYFRRDELPAEIAGGGHQQFIRDWLAGEFDKP